MPFLLQADIFMVFYVSKRDNKENYKKTIMIGGTTIFACQCYHPLTQSDRHYLEAASHSFIKTGYTIVWYQNTSHLFLFVATLTSAW